MVWKMKGRGWSQCLEKRTRWEEEGAEGRFGRAGKQSTTVMETGAMGTGMSVVSREGIACFLERTRSLMSEEEGAGYKDGA